MEKNEPSKMVAIGRANIRKRWGETPRGPTKTTRISPAAFAALQTVDEALRFSIASEAILEAVKTLHERTNS